MPELEHVAPPQAPPPETRFLTRREVARLFGVSGSTVTRWARTGLLRAVRTPGGHHRFRADEMYRVVEALSAKVNDSVE